MVKYMIEGKYMLPEWWEIETDADDEIEAEEQALSLIRTSAPEHAVDFEIYDTRVIE